MEITAQNAIYLGEETGGKGRQFKSRFLVPGLVKYDYGVCLLTKENADKFIQGFTGCPVIINHQDVTDDNVKDVAVGDIFSVWFDENDGYYWCNGIIRDKEAIKLINEGYSVSCQYLITEYSDNTDNKLHNGNPYDKIIENGKPEHLAIVNNPRYEGAIIAVNAVNLSSLPSGENTNSTSASEVRIVSEGLGNTTADIINPSPENLTFDKSQVDFLPSPDGRGIMQTASNSFIDQFKDTLYEVLAEGIYNRLLGCSHLTSSNDFTSEIVSLSARNPLGELIASNEDKWITMKKNGKTWKVKIEEKPENYNADKKLAAWAILSAGTGKKIPWLRMNLKRSEKLQELLSEPDDKLQTSGVVEAFADYYPDLYKISYENDEDSNGSEAAKILERVYDDLLNDNFYDNSDTYISNIDVKEMIKSDIKKAKKNIQSDYVKGILKKSDKITDDIFENFFNDFDKFSDKEQAQISEDYNVLSDIYDLQKMLGDNDDR